MAKATKTIKQALVYKTAHAPYFAATKTLFNQVAAFYFEVIQAHPGILDLSSKEALTALETLTHATKANPFSVMPLSSVITADIPAMFRRAAIHAALGSAHSFYTHLEKWHKQKEKAVARGKKFSIRPPVPPRSWNESVTLYAGQWKERMPKSIMLKVWTGSSWAWIKCGLQGRDLPDEWDQISPTLVQDGSHCKLHTALQKKFAGPAKVEHQLTTNAETRICSIDLNITKHLAVCTILTVEGTVVATRFIGGGKELHGLRKRQLGRVARNRSKTGIIAEGEQDNAALWAKIRALDEDCAHQISHRIIAFAKAHQASILVFEHLGHFKPQKGKYSKRGNEKRSYWLRGKIFKYTKYKAYNEGGLITCRVSPRNTSRECARCGSLVARYDAAKLAEGYTPGAPLVFCAHCNMRGNADRNASIVIGKRLLARYQTPSSQTTSKEKPQAVLATDRPVKTGGDLCSQDAESRGRLSTDPVRHGTGVEQGTAHVSVQRMVRAETGIPQQLRLFNES
ncbi:MAG TPA: transposase [Ktedonobacteraceae bacterium]|nr:transposase [Ktedonobacteraceae bacterium]